MIPQSDLPTWCFSNRDAILLTDEAQVHFLERHTNSTFQNCRLVPLAVQALAAAIRSRNTHIEPHFEHIDFPSCRRHYLHTARRQSAGWLKELGLDYVVKDLDVAKLDAPNQFLFFLLAAYLEHTAESVIRALPEIETFYIVTGEIPLPLEFYFDSDVPAAILRFICEREGRSVRMIHMQDRPHVFPYYSKRPMAAPTLSGPPHSPEKQCRKRAGFAPATVAHAQQILDAMTEMQWETLLFDSVWHPPAFSHAWPDVYSLNTGLGPGSEEEGKLSGLWGEVQCHLPQSSLMPAIAQNPHLAFQFEYIIQHRWHWYAAMIHAASRLVAKVPLDVFIHSDTFTAEGAVLSHFYRRQGTPIVVAAHSGWPCDPNWSVRQSSDIGISYSRSAAGRLRQISGMKSFVVGSRTTSYRSILRFSEQELAATKRSQLQGRKLVVFITNALELLCVPHTDLLSHFATLPVLAQVPQALQKTVLVAIRTKARPLGEDPILYRILAGFAEESVTFLDGLSFSQCLRLADCVVGINIPTTGYYEAMELGVPLLHVQTTQALTLQPDLPRGVTGSISSHAEIWDAVAGVLFDTKKREELLRQQRQFISQDRKGSVSGPGSPLRTVLEGVTNKPRSFFRRWQRKSCSNDEPPLSGFDLRGMRIVEAGLAGYIDDVLIASDESMAFTGWAADLIGNRPARRVHVVLGEKWLASGVPSQQRPDVAAALCNDCLRNAGFWIRTPAFDVAAVKDLSFYAELHNGTVGRLIGPIWKDTETCRLEP